jgi:hypothetical protein
MLAMMGFSLLGAFMFDAATTALLRAVLDEVCKSVSSPRSERVPLSPQKILEATTRGEVSLDEFACAHRHATRFSARILAGDLLRCERRGRHSRRLPSRALRPRRIKATLNSRAVIPPTVERSLKLLRCPEVLKVVRVRAISGLFLEEIINSPGHQLQILHLALRHRSRLAKS